MNQERLREFLAGAPGAAWIVRRLCLRLLADGSADAAERQFISWLLAEVERYANDEGHLQ